VTHPHPSTALVVGASGGIGNAVLTQLLDDTGFDAVWAVSRSPAPPDFPHGHTCARWLQCDNSAASIADCVARLKQENAALRRVVICSGVLHNERVQPEKSLEQLHRDAMLEVLDANAVTPALWLSALAALLKRDADSVIAVLNARVGSIEDNRLGGWYSYRASKAALNMLMKTAAIELARRAPGVKLLAFHPGTTDTALSRPFQKNVPEGKLFSPAFVAERLLSLMDTLPRDSSLAYLDWDAQPIPW
tara:strand:- start:27827 stop:28570 length:744 start_codon:yes stop_codon:yes gene_type:complete